MHSRAPVHVPQHFECHCASSMSASRCQEARYLLIKSTIPTVQNSFASRTQQRVNRYQSYIRLITTLYSTSTISRVLHLHTRTSVPTSATCICSSFKIINYFLFFHKLWFSYKTKLNLIVTVMCSGHKDRSIMTAIICMLYELRKKNDKLKYKYFSSIFN